MDRKQASIPAYDPQVQGLIRQLVDIAVAMETGLGSQIDAIIDPSTGKPVLLDHTRAEPGVRDELEWRIQALTAELGKRTAELAEARKEIQAREEQVRRYAERLQILHEVDEAILSARSAEEMSRGALGQVSRLMPCQQASVLLFDLQAEQVSLLATFTGGKTTLGNGWHGPMEKEWMWVVEKLARGKEHIIDDMQTLPPRSPLMAKLKGEGIRARIYEPLLVQGTLIGSLNLGMSMPGPLPAEQIEIARELADVLSIGIQQTYLYEEVQRYTGALEQRVQQRTAELSEQAAALQVSEARFRAVFEEAALGIALVDRDGRIMSNNPALERMTGYSSEELESIAFMDLVAAGDDGRGSKLFQELVAGRQSEYTLEQRYARRDGGMVDVNVVVSLVRPAASRARFAIALVEDVTERKRAQTALIQSERLAIIGRLAASLAHEINNPLQSVIGCLDLANELLEAGEDAGPFMKVAIDELERASRIVHQMRDLHHHTETPKQPGNINGLIQKVLLLSKKQCQDRCVEVVWEPGRNLLTPLIVPDRIQQVLLNLVLNAVDAMPGGGEMRILTAQTEDPLGVRIEVADTGIGIPPDDLARLFEAFHTTKEQGLGLGLYVSHGIVQDHGGRMEVWSEVGKGTTFTVWLPVQGGGRKAGDG